MDRIHGYIENVSSAAIQGWIANFDHPSRLEGIVCWGKGGKSLRFQACMQRPDVSGVLSIDGRFGFAIPTEAVRTLGSVVRLTSVHGETLDRGDAITLPPAAAGPPDRLTWVVVHIQKTAGTSLRVALDGALTPGQSMFVYHDGLSGVSLNELGDIPVEQREALRLVMGHTYFGTHAYLPRQAAYVTILRDPEARLRSHYFHHLACGTQFRLGGAAVDTCDVVQRGLTDEFDNLMTRMVAGIGPDQVPLGQMAEEHVDFALQTIRERFRFVGLTERLDVHFPALCRIMGLPPAVLPRENICRIGNPLRMARAIDWHGVMHRNRFDTMLYARVRAEGLCGRDLGQWSPV